MTMLKISLIMRWFIINATIMSSTHSRIFLSSLNSSFKETKSTNKISQQGEIKKIKIPLLIMKILRKNTNTNSKILLKALYSYKSKS